MQTQRDPTEVMGRRIAAYIIDGILISGIAIALLAATKQQGYTDAPARACQALRADQDFSGQCLQFGSRVYTWKSGGLAVGYGLSALAGFVNLVLLQGIIGASIGKLIVGLRVVNVEGKPCGVGRAFLRWIILIFVDGSCFLVGLLVSTLTHPHRRVGDMAAGTYVVALADVGRPVVAPPAYPYQYGQPGPGGPGWSPPGAAPPPAPGWGTAPPPAWGAPPPPPAPTWGAPPAPPAYGAAPPPAPPAWNAPPPAPVAEPPADRSGWGAPASPWTRPTISPPEQTPPPVPTPPPPAPGPPPAADPAPPAEGESWWNKAIGDDEEPEN